MVFFWVYRAELQEKLPLSHWLLSRLDISFTVMGGLCSLVNHWLSGYLIGIQHRAEHWELTVDFSLC